MTFWQSVFFWLLSLNALWGQIQANQKLRISLMGTPIEDQMRLNGDYQVDPQGHLHFAEVGHITAAGRRQLQLAHLIEERLKEQDVFAEPVVLFKDNSDSGEYRYLVQVTGHVANPGMVACGKGFRLAEILAAAELKVENWGPLEVRVTRDRVVHSLVLVTGTKFGLERIYPGDDLAVICQSPWQWFRPQPVRCVSEKLLFLWPE
ncbi:polysaccharide biosynthesis/export family protein [Roseibacillus ishigakijimensis]|nr:polysaccharide biosynthesis/export family protein [Roseibacillus ishigakijimensis]